MANNVAVIAAFREPIPDNMPIKPNVQSAAMFMEQMDQTCMKGAVQNVKRERPASGTGKLLKASVHPLM